MLLILLLFASSARAQPAETADPSLPGENLIRYSLQVEAPATARRELTAANDALAHGDVLAAVESWRRLVTAEPPVGFVPLEDSLVTPEEYLRHVLPRQSDEVREEWERTTTQWVSKALQAALARNDLEQLQKIARQATGSASGRQAAIETAARCYDAQRYEACAAACAWLLDSPLTDRRLPQGTLGLWWATSLERLGAREDALDVWARFREDVPPELAAELERDRLLGPLVREWDEVLLRRSPEGELPEASIAELLPADLLDMEPPDPPVPTQLIQLLRDFETIAHPLLMLKGEGAVARSVEGLSPPELAALARRVLGEAVAIRDLRVGDRIYRMNAERRLEAVNAETGEPLWRADQAWPHLLGELSYSREAVHVIGQDGSNLWVTAVNADSGAVAWTTRLGSEGLPRQLDLRRQWMPAVGIGAGDKLVYATGNGALVAVEAGSGRIAWVHRVSREDWRDAGPPLAPVAPHSPRMRLMTGWREPGLWRAGDVVVWASPEADQLLGVDRRSGKTVWSRPRGEGLAVQPAAGLAVILEPRGVRGVRVADGLEAWAVETPPIAGLGFVEQGWAVIPLRTGGTIAIRLRDGRIVRGVHWEREIIRPAAAPSVDRELRSLTWTADGISVRDLSGERVVPVVASRLDEERSIPHLAAAGELKEVLSRLSEGERSSPEIVARSLAQLRWQAILQSVEGGNSESLPDVAPFRLSLDDVADPEERLSLAILRWRLQPSATAAATLLAVACEVDSPPVIEVPGDPLRRVRADTAAVGTLVHEGNSTGSAPEIPTGSQLWDLTPAAEQALETAIVKLEERGAGDVADRLLLQLTRTGWGAERWLSRVEQRGEPAESLPIAERLALDLRLAVLERIPGVPGERAGEMKRQLTVSMSAPEDWPRKRPRVSVRKWTSSIATRPVERIRVAAGATDRLQVEMDIRNGQPRFSGAGEDRPWSPLVVKPERSLHVVPAHQRAWLLGSAVLVQAGTRLLAVSPFGADGRRDAEYLWPADQKVDTWGSALSANVGFLPRIGDASPGSHLPDLDEFGRPLAQVGPVSTSWFGLRQFSRYVAFDTLTGRRLWEREQFEKSALACGDDGVAILLMPGQVDVLSPFDGRLLHSWVPDFELSEVTELRGRTIIVFRPTDFGGVTLMARDGVTGDILWKQPAKKGTRVCSAGRFQILVTPGTIQVLDSDTGNVLAAAEVETPAELAHAAAIADEHGLIVLASGPPALAQERLAFQSTGGHRRPFANGRLFGFDSQSLELRWTIPMEKSVFPLDQPPDVPVLVINDAVYDESLDENAVAIGRLRCFDKRTGELLYEGTADELGRTAHVIERDPARQWVEVRTSKAIVRFKYAAEEQLQSE